MTLIILVKCGTCGRKWCESQEEGQGQGKVLKLQAGAAGRGHRTRKGPEALREHACQTNSSATFPLEPLRGYRWGVSPPSS